MSNSSILSSHNHILQEEGPGSLYNRGTSKTIVPPNRMHIGNFFSDMHYHLYLKFGLAKAIIEVKRSPDAENKARLREIKKLYEKTQRKRAGVSNFGKFKSLTETILEGGYSNKSIVPVDNAFNILDGSHRLGILGALGQHPVVEVLTAPSHYYGRKWFETNGFTETELEIMDDLKRTFFRQYFEEPEHKQHLCFIWGSTIRDLGGSWEKVLKEIGEENLGNFYIRNFGSELENVIGLTYLNDGIGQSTLRAKTEWITQKSQGLLGIISLTGSEDPKVLKEKVRSRIYPLLSDYAFDSIIHVVDEVHPNGNKIRHSIDAVVKNMNALLYI